jgi:hypothetical protein
LAQRILDIYKTTWLDKATFKKIFFVWLSITIIFGLVYFFLANDDSHLVFAASQTRVSNLVDCIYFSFVAATTTGFGDIVPSGFFKAIAVIQVVIGLLLLALVTSRLVSIKQDAILTQLYDFSLRERTNRLRTSLVLFRQSLERIHSSLEEKEFKQKDLKSLNGYLTSFDLTLNEIRHEFENGLSNKFIKKLDEISSEMLFNSTINSLEKIEELFSLLEAEKIHWKKEVDLGIITKTLSSCDSLFLFIKNSGLKNNVVFELEQRKNESKQKIKDLIFD